MTGEKILQPIIQESFFQAMAYANACHSHIKANDNLHRGGEAIKHTVQVRKYTGDAYIIHPIDVFNILSSVTEDRDMLTAALLHDVIEDTLDESRGRTRAMAEDEIRDMFGEPVLRYVLEVTDISVGHPGNRQIRKEMDRHHLAKASVGGQNIKLADLISNSASILAYDKRFGFTYIQEKAALLEVLKEGHPHLLTRAADIVTAAYDEFGLDLPPHLLPVTSA